MVRAVGRGVGSRLLLLCAALLASAGAAGAARADDKTACIDASDRAQTLRDAHKLVEAREQFRACAQSTCPGVVQKDCAAWFDQTERAIPTIVVDAKDGSGNDVSAVKVTCDGRTLAERLEGTELPVDPGEHAFKFEAAGQPPVERTLVLKEGEKGRRIAVQIGAPSAPPALPIAPVAPSPAAAPAAPPPAPPPAPPSIQRTAGMILGGVGVAGVAAGAVLGFLATAAKSDYERNCGTSINAPSAGLCNQNGVNGRNDAFQKANLATGFLIGGAVVGAGGAILYFTAPTRATSQVGVGLSGLVVRGAF